MGVLVSPQWQTILPVMHELLAWIGQQDFSTRFYLAGGTALALQLGHRKSIDLDFFSEKDEIHERTRTQLVHAFAQRDEQVIESVDGNLVLLANTIHVGFFSYGYPLLEACSTVENVNLASLLDIGLMKLDAVIGRGSRKGFYDLYTIAQHIPLQDLLQAGARKYPGVRDFPLLSVESLVLFDNAHRDIQPELLVDIPWQQIENFFVEQGKTLGKLWFE